MAIGLGIPLNVQHLAIRLNSDQKTRFPSSEELNFNVDQAALCIERVQNYFASKSTSIDEIDGLSMSFDTWRFNLRKSNTEPLVRLNIETRGDHDLLKENRRIKEVDQ